LTPVAEPAPWHQSARAFLRRPLVAGALKALFSAAVLGYFAVSVDLAQVGGFLQRAAPSLVAAVCLLSLLRVAVGAWRFGVLLEPRAKVPLGALTRHCFIGCTFNQLLPTAIGGDALRVILLDREYGVPKTEGAVYMLVERLLGLAVLWAMGAALAPFAGLPTELLGLVYGATAATVIGIGGGIGVVRAVPVARLRFAVAMRAAEAVRFIGRHPRALAWALLGSLGFQFLNVFVSFLIAESMSLGIPVAVFFSLVPLVYLATLVPISFGGVGLREISFVYLFGFLDVPAEASLIIALGTYLSLMIPAAVGALFHWRRAPSANHSVS
jgi:glycosyltransferase 2 family protein